MTDDSEKDDLTKIEDLSEYLHEKDEDVDKALNEASKASATSVTDLPDLPADEDSFVPDETPPDLPEDETEATAFSAHEESDFGGEDTIPDLSSPNALDDTHVNSFASDTNEDFSEGTESFDSGSDSFVTEEETPEQFNTDMDFDSDDSFGIEQEDGAFKLDDSSSLEEEPEGTFDGSHDAFESMEEDEEAELATPEFQEEEEEEIPSLQADILDEEPVQEVQVTKAPSPPPYTPPPTHPRSYETFKDVKAFAERMTYGTVAIGGNPPFSIAIRNIKYKEDSEEILRILSDHGLLNNENRSVYEKGAETGALLISQISEYSAVYLAHKFRRFDVDLQVGLSEEMHPSKHYSNDFKGLVTKHNLFQNKEESLDLENGDITIDAILLSTTPNVENYEIKHYIGLATAHRVVDESLILEASKHDNIQDTEDNLNDLLENRLTDIYHELAETIKKEALRLKGNAVVGINYSLNPLINLKEPGVEPRYKITCTGNVVWAYTHTRS